MATLRYAALGAFALVVLAVSGYAIHREDEPVSSPAGIDVGAPPAISARPVAAFIGDSYTQGKGATSPQTRWVSLVAKHERWDTLDFGRGGTGYVTTADSSGCGLQYCPSYPQMIPTVEQYRPSVIVVAGGQNDFAAWDEDPAATAASVDGFYAKLRTTFPKARIIAVGPSTPQPAVTLQVAAFSATVQTAAAREGAQFVSLIDPNPIQQADLLPDHQHVDDRGHAAIAAQIEKAIDQ